MRIIIIHVPIFTPFSLKLTFYLLLRISENLCWSKPTQNEGWDRLGCLELTWVISKQNCEKVSILISKALVWKKCRWAATHHKKTWHILNQDFFFHFTMPKYIQDLHNILWTLNHSMHSTFPCEPCEPPLHWWIKKRIIFYGNPVSSSFFLLSYLKQFNKFRTKL